jgi:HD-like signal output (HDOD) protein
LIEIICFEVDSAKELGSIIGYDQTLVEKVLMTANEINYGYRGKVNTLSKAITVMGGERVKSICTYSLLMNLLANSRAISPAQREMLWKHSVAGSRIAAEMAKKRPWIDREEAAVFGLIYDIGWLVMLAYFNEQFTAIFETAARKNMPPWCVEMQYGLSHTQLGKCLVARWSFPEVFQAVIEFHHCPQRSRSFKTEVMFIHLVDALCNSREHPELVSEEMTLSLCRQLFTSEQEWLEYQQSMEKIWSEVDQLWNLLG